MNPSDLKTILHSKRANIYYLEKCRVMQKDGRVVYLTESHKENLYWNIPIANTTTILLGTGTSITQAAMRVLCQAGVIVGFCGGGGTPLLAGTDIEWLLPQNEYRPTEYVQGWLSFWFNDEKRLTVAKLFQEQRCNFFEKIWSTDRTITDYFDVDSLDISKALRIFRRDIASVTSIPDLLTAEARFTKSVYKYAANTMGLDGFSRDQDGNDVTNSYLNHGNYLAYGLAACTLWTLGIPHGFAVMHGKTRRGALVFDVADLIKDAVVLPYAFIFAGEGRREQDFRDNCLQKFTEHHVLDFMFSTVKECSLSYGKSGDTL